MCYYLNFHFQGQKVKTQDTELRLIVKCMPVKVRYMNVKLSMAETPLVFH